MYIITESQWKNIPEGYRGEALDGSGEHVCFMCFLTPDKSGGTTLCREYQHFVIVPDEWQGATWEDISENPNYSYLYDILQGLIEMSDDLRAEWRALCMERYKDDPDTKRIIALTYSTAESCAHREPAAV